MKTLREVRVLHLFTYLVIPAVIFSALWAVLSVFGDDLNAVLRWILIALGCIASYFLLKRMAIGTVLLYKAIAPMSIRKECRFTPSCSSYMIMAINKYGLFIGVYKGIRRILRCHPPNGGEDYP